MKLTSKELKRRAREALAGRYGLPMASFVIVQMIVLIVDAPFSPSLGSAPGSFQITVYLLSSFIISLLSSVLDCGLVYIHLNYSRGRETKVSDVFRFFTRHPDRIILSELLMSCMYFGVSLPAIACSLAVSTVPVTVFTVLAAAAVWILTLIPLCMLSLSYELVYYLLIERPDARIRDIFAESRRFMRGSKARKFYLNLSFLGMILLSVLSFGIGLLWVTPYISQTNTQFYRNVTGEI